MQNAECKMQNYRVLRTVILKWQVLGRGNALYNKNNPIDSSSINGDFLNL